MRRGRLWLVVIAPLVAVGLVGCGSSDTRQTTSEHRPTDAERVAVRILGDLPFFNESTPTRSEPHTSLRILRFATPAQKRRARAQADTPTSLAFWDGERGLIGGGRSVNSYCAGTISLTEDGGQSLHVVKRVPGIVDWVTASGTDDAWAHVESCGKNHAPFTLLGTHDGGRTWKPLFDDRIGQASFASGRYGIAFSRGGFEGRPVDDSIVRPIETSDGGQTWRLAQQRVCHGRFYGFTLAVNGVSFPDSDHAWVACTAILGTQIEGKTIYETSNGGKTWEKVSDNRRKKATEDCLPQIGYTSGISFTGDGFGILDMLGNGLAVTSDGGRHWGPIPVSRLPRAVDGQPELRLHEFGPATVTAPTTIFALTNTFFRHPVLLARSDDGGATWVGVHEWVTGGASGNGQRP